MSSYTPPGAARVIVTREADGVLRYDAVGAPAWSPDARRVAVPRAGDRVAVLDDASGETTAEFATGGALRALRWTTGDHLLTLAEARGRVVAQLREMPDGGVVAEAPLFQGEDFDLDLSADGRALWASPRWRGHRLANRYAAWLVHPTLERRASLDLLDVACRATGFRREDAELLGGSAMDDDGGRVAFAVHHQVGRGAGRAHVLVASLAGGGALTGRHHVAACGAWKAATGVRWIGRDTLLVYPEEEDDFGGVARVTLAGGASARPLLDEPPRPPARRLLRVADVDPATGHVLIDDAPSGFVLLHPASGATRPMRLFERVGGVCIDRWRPDSVLLCTTVAFRVYLSRADLVRGKSVRLHEVGGWLPTLRVLPCDRGVLVASTGGAPQWTAVSGERLRAPDALTTAARAARSRLKGPAGQSS